MKKLLFIFNPISGRTRIRSKLYEIIDFYSQNDYLITLYPTQKKGDGYRKMKELTDMYDLVVCSGGDGTLNEIVSGMLDGGRKNVLGYVPSGSTNDFARSIGIPSDVMEALPITIYGKPYHLDVGKFNDKYFVYVAAFGIFTNIPYSTPQQLKNTLGYLAYLLEGIKAISELKAYSLSMTYDGGSVTGKFIVGLITNSYSVAGFKNPSQCLTQLNDGLFEILLIRMPKNIIELQEIIKSLLNEDVHTDSIVCVQSAKVEFDSEPMNWTFDGEYGGDFTHGVISNMNCAVQIIAPEQE